MFATLLGDPGLINTQAERYGAVTAEKVNEFARERLGSDNRAKLIYIPRLDANEAPADSEVEAVAS